MKKKIISGLFIVVFVGALGFVTISEAVGGMENNRMNTAEMERRHRQYRGTRNDEGTQLEQKADTEESTDYSYDRRENSGRRHMRNTSQRHQDRMNNSCW